jgi:hypothetical protein
MTCIVHLTAPKMLQLGVRGFKICGCSTVEDLHTSPSLWTTLWTNVANGSAKYHVLLSRQPHSPNSKWGITKGWVAVHHNCKNVSCTQLWNKIVHMQIHLRYSTSYHMINPLTPELNPSTAWRAFLLGILLLEPCISLIHAWKTNKCNNYSFSILIMYGSSYVFRHYIAIFTRSVPSVFWEMLNLGAVDRILCMCMLCLVMCACAPHH